MAWEYWARQCKFQVGEIARNLKITRFSKHNIWIYTTEVTVYAGERICFFFAAADLHNMAGSILAYIVAMGRRNKDCLLRRPRKECNTTSVNAIVARSS